MDGLSLIKKKLLCVGLALVSVISLYGCEGDTGPAGPPGTPATFGGAGCNDCHHLNSLGVTTFEETFVAGLAGPDKTISAGTSTALSFDPTKLPAGETASTFRWERIGGLASLFTGTTTSTAVVTLPTVTGGYKAELTRHVKGLLVTTLTGAVLSDRGGIVPVNPFNLEESTASEYKLRVATASGKYYYGLARVMDSTAEAASPVFAAINPGINNVPINVPVLLRAATSSGYSWSVSSAPSGTAPVLNDATSQFPDFTALVPGTYVLTQGTGTTTQLTLYAGTWRGAVTGEDANGRPQPDSACTICHNDTIAPDKFTPWKNSGHAEIFKQNLNAGGHYGPSCFPCHTVGFNTSAGAVNNGFDDQPNYSAFTGDATWFGTTADATRYSRLWTTYPDLAKLTNVQCENCHGPQEMGPGVNSTAHANSAARISLSSDMCAVCHGEPARHARFQQWEESGHGNFELAVEEGTSPNCMGCHSAQGFLIFVNQLQAGNPLRTITTSAATGTWTTDTVQPQTCTACHDPHAQGTTSGEPNTATVRVIDNTPKLPGGFMATGVGRGAVCIVCHNSRNGGVSGVTNDTFLHQDGDPRFGTLSSYAAPHASAQGDVLLGYNAYFVGNGDYRSPHSLIADTCATCHMEVTPPPALLSYNLAGTNHTFRASITICSQCHPVNLAIGHNLQTSVKSALEALKESIEAKIISRTTGTPISRAELIESHGQPALEAVYADSTEAEITLNNIPGIRVADLGTDGLAKAVWNYLLIHNDQSNGIHNPDFTFAVLAGAQYAVDGIPDATVPSDE